VNTEAITVCEGVSYFPNFVDDADAALADIINQVKFQQRSRHMYGRVVATPRLEAWHGPHAYSFGGSTLPAQPLPPVLLALRTRVECLIADASFDGCLANLYRGGSDSVSWHSDDEPEMGDPIVASISLGAPRDFLLRRIDPTPTVASAMLPSRVKVTLAHGSLLVMGRGVQSTWQHSLPKRKKCTQPRVNLTFRSVEQRG